MDYDDLESLVTALKGVHTVISVLKIPGKEWASYQINLLNAAKQAGVKRFSPSGFEAGPLAGRKVELLKGKLPVRGACLAGGLEVTRFNSGMFMNHLALGRDLGDDDQRKLKVLGGFNDEPVIWDIAAGKVEEPVKDDGSSPRITLTLIDDIGKFVAAACELPEGAWEHDMGMVGENIAISDVTRLLEKVTGEKLDVDKINREQLDARVDSIDGCGSSLFEVLTKLGSQLALLMLEEKEGMMVMAPMVNRLCPQVKPMGVEQYLQWCWRG